MANSISTEQFKFRLLKETANLAHAIQNLSNEDIEFAIVRIDEVKEHLIFLQKCEVVENFSN